MRVAHRPTGQHQYVFDGAKLQDVQHESDLEVEVLSSLKPSLQCTKAAPKAMQVLGIIKRNFVMNDEEDFRLLANIDRLQRVQNVLARVVAQAPSTISSVHIRRDLHWLPLTIVSVTNFVCLPGKHYTLANHPTFPS